MSITPGIIQTVLGNGQEGWGGDGGPALQAACQTPYMCAFDTGALGDSYTHREPLYNKGGNHHAQ